MSFKMSFLTVLLFLGVSCKSLFYNEIEKKEIESKEVEIKPKILFLDYRIKNKNSIVTVQLLSKNKVEGKFKNEEVVKKRLHNSDLKILQLDENSSPIDSMFIMDPLREDIEYVNSKKELEKKTILHDSVDFFVRLQLQLKTKYISIQSKDKIFTNDVL